MKGRAGTTARSTWSFKRTVPLAVLVLGLGAFFVFGLDRYVGFEVLRENRVFLLDFVDRQPLLSALSFVLIYATAIALSLPGGALLTMAGGFLFGTYLATGCAMVGATVGATGLFLAARTALGDLLYARAGPALKRMECGFQENALSYLLVLRLVPLFPFWLVNLVPAFLGVRLRTYVLGTFIGIIPGTFVYASVGNGLGAFLDADQTPDLGIVFRWDILIPLIGLAVLALVPVLYRRLKRPRR